MTLELLAALLISTHPGGLNAEGCHTNRRTGDYHCHGGPPAQRPPQRPQGLQGSGRPHDRTYANCAAARAAGAAPVRIGEPGYGRHLDRDGDGVGCER